MGKAVCKRRPFATMTKYILYAPFYMWMRWYLFRFVIIIHCKKCYFVLEPMCKCLVWFEVFFYSFDDFFSMLWWNTITVFFRCFFVRFLCLVSLRRRGRFFSCWFVKRRFYEWIGLFVGWVVGEFVFFFLIPIFLNGIKKIYSMKEVFYVSFFIYRKHGWKKISRQNKRVWKKGMFIYKRLWYS